MPGCLVYVFPWPSHCQVSACCHRIVNFLAFLCLKLALWRPLYPLSSSFAFFYRVFRLSSFSRMYLSSLLSLAFRLTRRAGVSGSMLSLTEMTRSVSNANAGFSSFVSACSLVLSFYSASAHQPVLYFCACLIYGATGFLLSVSRFSSCLIPQSDKTSFPSLSLFLSSLIFSFFSFYAINHSSFLRFLLPVFVLVPFFIFSRCRSTQSSISRSELHLPCRLYFM